MDYYELVKEAYLNALENGYDLSILSNQEVAWDMCDCDSSLEVYEPSVVEIYVGMVRKDLGL